MRIDPILAAAGGLLATAALLPFSGLTAAWIPVTTAIGGTVLLCLRRLPAVPDDPPRDDDEFPRVA